MADDDPSSGSKLVAMRVLVVIENIHRFVMVTLVGIFHIKKFDRIMLNLTYYNSEANDLK
jgi:hypothetical protein